MLGPRGFSCKSLALSHRHAIEYPDSSVPRLATRGTILRRSSHVQRSNAPADGLRSMSVMGACAYFRAAELTVYGFPHLYLNRLRSCFGLVSALENDLIWRGAKGVAARWFHVSCLALFFPTPQFILCCTAQSPFPNLWRYIWAQHAG
jgi:hypothetical protein